MVALFGSGKLGFQVGAVALQLVYLPGQRCVLARKRLVLHHQVLGVAAQGVVLLPGSAGLGGSCCQMLLIVGAEVQHGLAHILWLIAAKPRLAHTALFYVVVDVNFGHW